VLAAVLGTFKKIDFGRALK